MRFENKWLLWRVCICRWINGIDVVVLSRNTLWVEGQLFTHVHSQQIQIHIRISGHVHAVHVSHVHVHTHHAHIHHTVKSRPSHIRYTTREWCDVNWCIILRVTTVDVLISFTLGTNTLSL